MHSKFLLPTIILVLAALFVVNATVAVVYNVKLMRYLKKHQKGQWQYLTTIGSIGPGASNPFRWFSYVFKISGENDKNVQIYKKRIRLAFGGCGLILILFFLIVIWVVLSRLG